LAQNQSNTEQRVPLTQPATAFDAHGAPAIEATLRTTNLSGSPESPVSNIRLLIKNTGPALHYVAGLVSFYDASGVRCGEGVFKLEELGQNETADTDAPGLRVTCTASNWRIVTTSLLPRTPGTSATVGEQPPANLVISIDGEEHPIQLGRPMVLNLGNRQRTITVRAAP